MTDFAWLIEAPGPRYLAARKVTTSHDFVWHADAALAVRFHSEDQADLVMMAVRQLAPDLFGFERTLGNAKPVEHGWIDGRSPAHDWELSDDAKERIAEINRHTVVGT